MYWIINVIIFLVFVDMRIFFFVGVVEEFYGVDDRFYGYLCVFFVEVDG